MLLELVPFIRMTCLFAAVDSVVVILKIKTALGLHSASRMRSPAMTGRDERDVRSCAIDMMIHRAGISRPGLGVTVNSTVVLTLHCSPCGVEARFQSPPSELYCDAERMRIV